MNHYTILMVGWNSREWIDKSLQSCLTQDHPNFDVIAIDAQTTDGTHDYLVSQQELFDNLTVVRNETRKYQTQNIYEGTQMAKEGSIIVTVDFDDWLPHPNVLTILDDYYCFPDVWMTYGSKYHTTTWKYKNPVGEGRYSDEIIRENKFRQDTWRASHLRTFRRELCLKIDPKDFIDTDGEWFKAAGDLTFMWPMLEMSGERFRYIEHGLYVYNEFNENSDFRKVPHEQLRIHEMLRQREPYKRLDSL